MKDNLEPTDYKIDKELAQKLSLISLTATVNDSAFSSPNSPFAPPLTPPLKRMRMTLTFKE